MFDLLPPYDPSEPTPTAPVDPDNAPAPFDLKLFWRQVFREHELNVQDRYTYRVRIAYRFAREVLHIVTDAPPERTLTQLGILEPAKYVLEPFSGKSRRPLYAAVKDRYLMSPLGMVPPPRDPDSVHLNGSYNPTKYEHHDRPYRAFAEVFEFVNRVLCFENGSPEDPQSGHLGLAHMRSLKDMRRYWPSWEDILLFESHLVQESLDQYASKGERGTRIYLRNRYGLESHEIHRLIHQARYEATIRVEMDVDVQKALAVKRLQDLIVRAQDACNLGAEIRAVKELHLVLGLGKIEPEDSLKAFTAAITGLAVEGRRSRELRSASPPLLDAKDLVVSSPEYLIEHTEEE